jgi:hypothetical protein
MVAKVSVRQANQHAAIESYISDRAAGGADSVRIAAQIVNARPAMSRV